MSSTGDISRIVFVSGDISIVSGFATLPIQSILHVNVLLKIYYIEVTLVALPRLSSVIGYFTTLG